LCGGFCIFAFDFSKTISIEKFTSFLKSQMMKGIKNSGKSFRLSYPIKSNTSLCLLWNQNSDTVIEGCHVQHLLQGRDATANPIIQNIIQACTPFKTCSDWCRYYINLLNSSWENKSEILSTFHQKWNFQI
jgi:hypothetical protein